LFHQNRKNLLFPSWLRQLGHSHHASSQASSKRPGKADFPALPGLFLCDLVKGEILNFAKFQLECSCAFAVSAGSGKSAVRFPFYS